MNEFPISCDDYAQAEQIARESKKNKIPVIEIFGPVIQGEGAMIGRWTSFVRTGGCDFRCTLCDSMHAVDPKSVQQLASYMTPEEIAAEILNPENELYKAPWVTFSGGNPAMWNLSKTVKELHQQGFKVAIETQGSIWQDWIADCDQITISPKSVGMGNGTSWEKFMQFMEHIFADEFGILENKICIKVPVFCGLDFDFAEKICQMPETDMPIYLSLGNPYPPEKAAEAGIDKDQLAKILLDNYARGAEELKKRPKLMERTIYLPQLHVLAYGNERCK